MGTYLAVKMDVRDSQKTQDRSELQKKLLQVTAEINRRFESSIQAKFVVTHGDEVQGLVRCEAIRMLLGMVEYYANSLRPVRVRFGIGLGTLSTELQSIAIGMDGPAWHHAKQAIEDAERTRAFIRFRGFGPETDSVLDGLANLLFFVSSRWTAERRSTIAWAEEGLRQTCIAERFRVSDAAISRRLSAAGWHEYREGRDALLQLLGKSVPQDSEGVPPRP